jgi:hypothetical protein
MFGGTPDNWPTEEMILNARLALAYNEVQRKFKKNGLTPPSVEFCRTVANRRRVTLLQAMNDIRVTMDTEITPA